LPLAAVQRAGAWLSFALAARRDHRGRGLFPEGGHPAAARGDARPVPLRMAGLQWTALEGWAAGLRGLVRGCGAAAKGIGQLRRHQRGALTKEFTRIAARDRERNAYWAALSCRRDGLPPPKALRFRGCGGCSGCAPRRRRQRRNGPRRGRSGAPMVGAATSWIAFAGRRSCCSGGKSYRTRIR